MANNLTVQMLAAAVLAVTLALLFGDPSWTTSGNTIYDIIALIKTTFLAALRMLIAPMIFFSLIAGISNISEAASLKRLGGYTVSYYLVTTLIAISIGLFVVFFVHPWTAHPPTLESTLTFAPERMIDPGSDSIIAILQKLAMMAFANPISSLANLNIVGIVTSAVLFGLAMVICLPASSPLFQLVKDINTLIMKILSWVIALLPIGIFAIIFDFTLKVGVSGELGGTFLTQLLQFGVTVTIITLLHFIIILPILAGIVTGQSPLALLKTRGSHSSSPSQRHQVQQRFPVSIKTAEEKLGVDKSVSSFVLPLGATMNMDGTALFEAVAAIFLAYLYGIELSTLMVITIFLMAMISSIGAPGMPTASMSGMQIVLLAAGIPLEAIAILLVIERPLDTFRTAVNVNGDLMGSVVVNHMMGRKNPEPAD